MAPCSGNVITPKMIRTGQVHIGDKIEFEREGNILVSSQNITPAEVSGVSSQNHSQAREFSGMQKVASTEKVSFENRTVNASAPAPDAGGMATVPPQASRTAEVMNAVRAGSQSVETTEATTAPQMAEMTAAMVQPQLEGTNAEMTGTQSAEMTAATVDSQTAMTNVAMAASQPSAEILAAAAEAVPGNEGNRMQAASASVLTEQSGEKTRGSIEQEQAIPTAATFSEGNSYAGDTMGNSMPSAAGTGTDNGVSLRQQHSQNTGNYNQQSNPAAAQTSYSNMIYTNTAQIPLAFQQMTYYVNSLENNGTQSPTFNVPSNPLVPPEYEQTIDYDSMQYMNGFLRTQIGRYMRVEQLIGAGTLEDRYGFLVGVGNNYLLLQDISNGNVSLVDIYTVKYVYIYFGEPVFPNLPFGNSGRQ